MSSKKELVLESIDNYHKSQDIFNQHKKELRKLIHQELSKFKELYDFAEDEEVNLDWYNLEIVTDTSDVYLTNNNSWSEHEILFPISWLYEDHEWEQQLENLKEQKLKEKQDNVDLLYKYILSDYEQYLKDVDELKELGVINQNYVPMPPPSKIIL